MPRQMIFSEIRTAAHPIPMRRLQFDPTNLQGNSASLNRLYPEWDRFVREYPVPHVGVEDFTVVIPPGMQYDGASVITLPPHNLKGSAVEIAKQPAFGVVGRQRLSVRYTVPPGGVIRYRVRAYGKPAPSPSQPSPPAPEIEILHITNQESVERLDSLMVSRQHVAVLFEGGEALKLFGTGLFKPGEWKISKGQNGLPQIEINPIWEFVVIIAILTAAFVSVVALLVIYKIVTYALTLGYKVQISELKLTEMQIGGQTLTLSLPTLAIILEPV